MTAAGGEGRGAVPGRGAVLGRGQWWAIASGLGYTAQALVVRAASAEVHPLLGVAVMVVPTWCFAAGMVLATGRRRQLLPGGAEFAGWAALGLAAASAVISYLVGNTGWLTAMRLGGLTIVAPGTQAVGLWSGLLGWLMLREPVPLRMRQGMAVFAVGAAVLALGRAAVYGLGAGWAAALPLAVLVGGCWATASLLIRMALGRGLDRLAALAVATAVGLVGVNALLITTAGTDVYRATPAGLYLLLLAGGLANLAAQYSLFTALAYAPVGLVGITTAALGALPPVLGRVLFGDPLNATMLAGIALVLAGGTLAQLPSPRG